MGMESEADGVPSYLQPDQESDLDGELNLPSAPTGQAATPAGRSNGQVYANSVCNHFYALLNNCLMIQILTALAECHSSLLPSLELIL